MGRIITYSLLLTIVILLIIGFDNRNNSATQVPGKNEQYYRIVSVPLPDTLSFAGEEVPLDLFYVREALDREVSVNTYWHSSTLQVIKKSARYFPMFDSILDSLGIPEDFKYLAVIESNLSNVRSPAGAVGYWQFLTGTAKDYNLVVDKEVDERYNVRKSTVAACEYLNESYKKFGNWTLVATAYNAGRRGISNQLERQKATSFYDMLLNDETSRYIYRILAMKLIFERPEVYGFYIRKNDYYPIIPTRKIKVEEKIEDLAEFAKSNNISYKLLKTFNPWLRQNYLKNKKKRTYYIEIPLIPYNLTHEEIVLKKSGLVIQQ